MRKIDRLSGVETWGVHDGIFHADDVFAGAMIKLCNKDATCVRTRDLNLLKECDIVIDVGDTEYDHHKDLKFREDSGIPMCGFGLLWSKFDLEVIIKVLKRTKYTRTLMGISDSIVKNLITYIDAMDNGVNMIDSGFTESSFLTITSIISNFNFYPNVVDKNEQYLLAVDYAAKVLESLIIFYKDDETPYIPEYDSEFVFQGTLSYSVMTALGDIVELNSDSRSIWSKYGRGLLYKVIDTNDKNEVKLLDNVNFLNNLYKSLMLTATHNFTNKCKVSDISKYYNIPTAGFILRVTRSIEADWEFLKTWMRFEIYKSKYKTQVTAAYITAKNANKNYMILQQNVPYIDTLHYLDTKRDIKLVIYQKTENSDWCVSGVCTDFSKFDSQISFPVEWCGLSGKELESVSGIKGMKFCHKNQTFAVTDTLDRAIEVSKYCLIKEG